MPEGERSTICISSQVGCPVDCKFCLTALMGLERNLTAGEIVGQVLRVAAENRLEANADRVEHRDDGPGRAAAESAQRDQGDAAADRSRRHGDFAAADHACRPRASFRRSRNSAQEPVRPKLAISLNASTEEQRRELMPITRKYHLKDLIDACRAYPLRPWEKLTLRVRAAEGRKRYRRRCAPRGEAAGEFEREGEPDRAESGPGIPFETPDPERVAAFQEIVRRSMPCFIRKPRGLDVFAACGQLKRMESDFVHL